MLKRIVIEKCYLLLVIIAIGGYAAASMLYTEHDSSMEGNDTFFQLFVVVLFVSVAGYLMLNLHYLKLRKLGKILLFLSCYMVVCRILALPNKVGVLSYIFRPMIDLLIIELFLLAYVIAQKSEELLNFFTTCILLSILIFALFYIQNWLYLNAGNDEYHLGTAYYPLFLLPVLMFTSYKPIRYLAIVIAAVILMSSFKRAGLLAFILAIAGYIFVKQVFIRRKVVGFMWFMVAVLVILSLFLYVDHFILDDIFIDRFLSIEEDGGSGRDMVWLVTMGMISQNDMAAWLFGNGYNAVLQNSPLGFSAHNDFLEMLYNYGIFCFVLYVWLHGILIQKIFKGIKQRTDYAPTLAFSYIIFIVLSMVSHVIVYPWMCLLVMCWGVVEAKEEMLKQ